jgi:hypothetical protein
MTTQIVTVNVTQTIAPAPSQLQRTGCFVSQGATTLGAGKTALLTQFSDLSSILAGAVSIGAATWSANTVTLTTSAPHGIPSGDTVLGVIVGLSVTALNGTFSVTSTSTNTLTYTVTGSGSVTTTGATFTNEDVQELVAMATTFFAQGSQNAIYVLELGAGTPAQGVTALIAYLASPTIRFYAYLLPNTWAGEATAVTMALNNDSTTAQVYFWVSANLANYSAWTGKKSAVVMVEDVNAPVTECSAAAMLWNALNYNPSDTNKVAPMAFQYVVGVTPFSGNQTVQQTLKTANVNYIGTGAEGGISNTLILWGVTADGRDYTYWYSVDWVQININLSLSNAIINGSNNPINPLYYNQAGINTLQKVAQGTMNSGVAFGLVLPPVTVQAVSFSTYVTNNPSDYSIGKYAGLSVTYTPARGFTQIIFNVNVSDFALA